MSHFSKINVRIRDEEALKAATDKMGFPLIPNGQCRYFFGAKNADFVIRLPGDYDVALNRSNGGFDLEADLFDGQVQMYLGPDAGLLMRQYAAEKARTEAFKHSLAVTEETSGNDIILTLTDTDTGGQISVICHIGGKVEVKTSGFPGQSCMKFQDLEKALGAVEDFSPTMEMYEEEPLEGNEHVFIT